MAGYRETLRQAGLETNAESDPSVLYAPLYHGELANEIDRWGASFSAQVVKEFLDAKKKTIADHERNMTRQRHREAHQLHQKQDELEQIKENLNQQRIKTEKQEWVLEVLTKSLGVMASGERKTKREAFILWKVALEGKRRFQRWDRLGQMHYKKVLMRKAMGNWMRYQRAHLRRKLKADFSSQLEKTIKHMQRGYEMDVHENQERLREAQRAFEHAEHQRQQTLDTMKRAYRRGLTALQVEATDGLSIKEINDAQAAYMTTDVRGPSVQDPLPHEGDDPPMPRQQQPQPSPAGERAPLMFVQPTKPKIRGHKPKLAQGQ